jgi:ABC-type enterochelin transport system permease subunit
MDSCLRRNDTGNLDAVALKVAILGLPFVAVCDTIIGRVFIRTFVNVLWIFNLFGS